MNKYDILREAFPNCGIGISPNGISLILPRFDGVEWVSENIGNEDPLDNKPVFDALIGLATHVTITCGVEQMTRITFHAALPIDRTVVYPPVNYPKSAEEKMNQYYAQLERDGKLEEHLRFYDHLAEELDMNNPEDVWEALRRILDSAPEERRVFDLNGLRRWEDFVKTMRAFIRFGVFTDYQVEPPDENLDFGTGSFYIETTGSEKRVISDEKYKAFRKMLEEADIVEISTRYWPGNSLFSLTVYS